MKSWFALNISPLKVLLFSVVLWVLLASCGKETQKFSDIPFIRYEGFEQLINLQGKDSIGIMRLYFTDGDGDLGLGPSDTLPPYNPGSLFYYNFIIDYFEKQNGDFVKVVIAPPIPGADTITNNSRIPRLVPQGRNRSLEGTLLMELFTNNPLSAFDTIKYRAYIIDRALNKSNVIETPELVIRK
jgi:hypothetical protein